MQRYHKLINNYYHTITGASINEANPIIYRNKYRTHSEEPDGKTKASRQILAMDI